MTKHLASCERCYAVFSGVVRFQLDEENEEQAGEVVIFDRGRRRRWRIPTTLAAALALLGIGVGSIFWSRPMTVAKLVAPVEGRTEVASRLWEHAKYRGPGDAEGGDSLAADAHASVQAGALFVDFQLAAGAGDDGQAREIWRSVGNAVANTLVGAQEAQAFYDDAAAIETEGALDRILKSLPERERRLEKDEVVHPRSFRLGKWMEAGRLAAELEEPKFFTRWANRQFLRSVLADEEMALSGEARGRLEAIDQAWGSRDYAVLADHFQAVLDIYDFRPS